MVWLDKKVLIIGAGVGGLAAAVRLLGKGYKVEIYDKEKSVGGKVNFIEENGFRFDLTASIFMTPDIYKDVFKYVGKDYKNYLKLEKLDPIYRAYYADGSQYDFSSDLVKLTKTLESISKEDSIGYLKLLSDVYEKYLIADEFFLQKTFDNVTEFINPVTVSQALKIKTLSNTYDFISRYVKSEKLRQYLCFQSMYVGSSPYDSPNIYTLIPAVSHIYGLWHLKGGMYSYIEALEKIIIELGGSINTNVNVEEILISQEKAMGIRTSSETKLGDIIICNADFPYAVKELIKDEKPKGIYTDEKISSMKYTCSNFILYLGLKKKYDQLLVHNFYFGDEFKKNIEAIFKGFLPEKPSLYIYCPSRIDKSMADRSKECLNAVVRVPNLLFNNIKWDVNTINLFRNKIIQTIKKIKGLEDIEKNIILEKYLTPKDFEKLFNSYGGTAYGLSHTLTQTNYFRPQVKSPTVENLFFVGSSVHPGTGVSIVLLSSKLAVEEILKDNKIGKN